MPTHTVEITIYPAGHEDDGLEVKVEVTLEGQSSDTWFDIGEGEDENGHLWPLDERGKEAAAEAMTDWVEGVRDDMENAKYEAGIERARGAR